MQSLLALSTRVGRLALATLLGLTLAACASTSPKPNDSAESTPAKQEKTTDSGNDADGGGIMGYLWNAENSTIKKRIASGGRHNAQSPFRNGQWHFIGERRKRGQTTVYRMDYPEAVNLAYKITRDAFYDDIVVMGKDNLSVGVQRMRQGSRGNAFIDLDSQEGRTATEYHLGIVPQIVEDADNPGQRGAQFTVYTNRGYGRSEARRRLTEALERYAEDHALKTATYERYRVNQDVGVADTVPDSIPTSYGGFKAYLDNQESLDAHEGIWTLGSRYTLGIYVRPNDPRYKYYAFVIDTKDPRWEVGQIKAKFVRLNQNKDSAGVFLSDAKAEQSMEAVPSPTNISMVVAGKSLKLSKSYPIHDLARDRFRSMGTGWAVNNQGVFVTNYHVVENADKIFIGDRDDHPIRAKVLITDRRTDLALLQLKTDTPPSLTPLPLSGLKKVANGTEVVAIGYPLAGSVLGETGRVVEGIIAAQNGMREDVTRYQMTPAIDHGNSGGPVVDDSGNVVGVSVEGLATDEKTTVHYFAVKINYVRALLDQLEIDYQTGNNDNSLNSKQIFERYEKAVLPVWTE